MFDLDLSNEEVIMQIWVKKSINTKDLISNFVANVFTPAGGDIADNVKIIVTPKYLYLAYMGHTAIGYAEEIRNLEKIEMNKLKDFVVVLEGDQERIDVIADSKIFKFTRDNKDDKNLAKEMQQAIIEMRK